MILLVGLLPSKILDLTKAALEAASPSSSRTSFSVFPNASALDISTGRRNIEMDVLGLSKEVGEEDLVVLSARDGVEGLDGSKEITTSQPRSLSC